MTIKLKVNKNNSINKKVVSRMKDIVDEVESKIDCTGGYSLYIGRVYIDNHLCSLFLHFGYSSYFYALDNKSVVDSKSTALNSKYTDGIQLEDMKFSLICYEDLYKAIEDKIKIIIQNHNDDIANKENFCEKLNEKG